MNLSDFTLRIVLLALSSCLVPASSTYRIPSSMRAIACRLGSLARAPICTWRSGAGVILPRTFDFPKRFTNPALGQRLKSDELSNPSLNQNEMKFPMEEMFERNELETIFPAVDLWDQVIEKVPVNIGLVTSSGNITIGAWIRSGGRSAIYGIHDNPNHLIKYQRYTPGRYIHEPKDPILREALTLQLVNQIPGIAPKLVYYSAAAPSPTIAGKLAVDESPQPNQSVRYMVYEKVGKGLDEYRSEKYGIIGVIDAVKIGIEMINLLQQIHLKFNIIHVGIYPGNFAVNPKTGRLLLTDFGYARIVDSVHGFPEGELTPIDAKYRNEGQSNVFAALFQSQWEDRYITPSFRDDIYNAMFFMAMMIHGYAMDAIILHICDTLGQTELDEKWRTLMEKVYVRVKSTDNFFDADVLHEAFVMTRSLSKFEDPIPFPHRMPDDVLYHFDRALDILRGTPISEKPDYDAIISELRLILNRIDSTASSNDQVDFDL